MKTWHIQITGLVLMLVGGFLFVVAVRDLSGEGVQLATGLAAVFCVSFGFGLIILPWNPPSPPKNPNSMPPPGKEESF